MGRRSRRTDRHRQLAPRAAQLEDEPYWPALARLVDWADEHTISTVWSCLAAHAAVHRLDGIARQPFDGKLFGVFDCMKIANHPLVGFGPGRVANAAFALQRAAGAGPRGRRATASWRAPTPPAPIFSLSSGRASSSSCKAIPEYDAGALLREYRRNVWRFLDGESEAYPVLPHGYFTDTASDALRTFRQRALERRDTALLEQFPAAIVGRELAAPWRDAAARLYSNWLGYLARNRARRLGTIGPKAPVQGSANSVHA